MKSKKTLLKGENDDMSSKSLKSLEKIIGYNFENQDLLHEALTHPSTGKTKNYERLEFLGDRVLGLVVSHLLYQKFPDETEGDMAKRLSCLVQGSMIAEIASKINLGDYILFSDAERKAGGAHNENILADVFEALIGALYQEAGLPICENFITAHWADVLTTMKTPPQHPKTALQEWAQSENLPLPEYKISDQHGPDHAPIFDISVNVKGHPPVTAQGKSRQEAEKEAAQQFLKQVMNKS